MVKKYPKSPPKVIVDESPSHDETQAIQIVDGSGYPVLTFDADDYREYVCDMNLSKKQESELLRTLWSIIVQFVDLGFGIESVGCAVKCAAETQKLSPEKKGTTEKREIEYNEFSD